MPEVNDNTAQSRFELTTGDDTAIAVYDKRGKVLAFVHTEVPDNERGEGVGDQLIGGALQIVRQRGEKIIPACEFVEAYVERHPETRDLVASEREPG